MKKSSIIAILSFFVLIPQLIHGQEVEAGIMSSARSFGAVVDIRGRQTTSRVAVCADLYKVLDGTCSSPGYRASYCMSFPLLSKDLSEDCRFAFEAGPGMTAGFTRDGKKDRGAMAGLSGVAVIDLIFRRITISCSAMAILGFHLDYENSGKGTLELYRNGLKDSWMPEISIKYRF